MSGRSNDGEAVAAWQKRLKEFTLVGSRHHNKRARLKAELAGESTDDGLTLEQVVLAKHGLPADFWLPYEIAVKWRTSWYPIERSVESVRQWEGVMQSCSAAGSLFRFGNEPHDMLANLDHDRELIRKYDSALLAEAGPPKQAGENGQLSIPPAIAKRDAKTEARDKWIYGEVCQGTVYATIVSQLKATCPKKKWEPVESVNGIKDVAKRYAERHNLTSPPPRQRGRPVRARKKSAR